MDPHRDPDSGLLYVSAPGFHVVAVDQGSDEALNSAVSLVARLRGANPLDIGMLAFDDEVRCPAALVNSLAELSIMVSRSRAESALAKAHVEIARYLDLRKQGDDNMARFMQSMSMAGGRFRTD
ncbi:hypothetical protein LRS03_04390 [Rhizobacter sp. J219]|jgi:hypothetical protein|uniref:Uncharacterized protein n=1 Tax=Piscinibacter gummiphilus TaxID=946333 RepID=A0ABZ0CSI4_9BURK|nr:MULTISPECIES: hypothetical protein [Burkholderiales]MCR5882137.1 hypothetical protein [Rhizobacter sp. J219]WOB05877.1 hypothetical protein RXV79_13190 [Piscinibacter gummiphilus]